MGEKVDVAVVGAGMAGLTAAALLVQRGKRVALLDQNWLPGGCASAYPRHGHVFESGATTLVGLDAGMPLQWLLDRTGIAVEAWRLARPMAVHLPDGRVVERHPSLEAWIAEAERSFGVAGQRAFWEECHRISLGVWETSIQQRRFPPTTAGDLFALARHATPRQFTLLPKAFQTVHDLLCKHRLQDHAVFRRFVDAQLLISAQNTATEVNALFGATALCYTLLGNYYVPGGMIGLAQPIADYVAARGGDVRLRQRVTGVARDGKGYRLTIHKQAPLQAQAVVMAIPLNNALPLMDTATQARCAAKVLPPERLWSAFTMGIAFKDEPDLSTEPILHHQILLPEALPQVGATSIFVSLSHPQDNLRSATGARVACVSMHIARPHEPSVTDKEALCDTIAELLVARGLLPGAGTLYRHASAQGAWEKWTGRAHGFVGGYPQYRSIRPWQMKDARLDGQAAYICGDSTYPGQGIPGACLSGIIAVEKLRADLGW